MVIIENQLVYKESWVTHECTWQQIILMNGNMETTIPSLFHNTSLDMQTGARYYKIWSPNISHIPPYPFLCPQALYIGKYVGYYLLDGSGGHYVPGFYLQVLTDNTICLAFLCLCTSWPHRNQDASPESSFVWLLTGFPMLGVVAKALSMLSLLMVSKSIAA